MTDLLSEIKEKFKVGNIAIQFIYINTGLFIVTRLLELTLYLFGYDFSIIHITTSLPANLTTLALRPWSMLTYMFMHAGLLHLFFNMLLLYWFGQFFLSYYSAKHLRGLYFLGGIVGGAVFLLAYALFPALKPMAQSANLVGASAAVLAIVIAIATHIPNQSVRLFLIGSIKLKYLAIFVILTDLLMIINNNPGGHIAHLGGALAGFCFTKSIQKGIDPTKWINILLDTPLFIRDFIRKKRKTKQKMKVAYKNTSEFNTHSSKDSNKKRTEEIDTILDKIKESGYNNLTGEEKQKLFDAGK